MKLYVIQNLFVILNYTWFNMICYMKLYMIQTDLLYETMSMWDDKLWVVHVYILYCRHIVLQQLLTDTW